MLELLERIIPGTYKDREEICYKKEKFYYDPAAHMISDALGNEICIQNNGDRIAHQPEDGLERGKQHIDDDPDDAGPMCGIC